MNSVLFCIKIVARADSEGAARVRGARLMLRVKNLIAAWKFAGTSDSPEMSKSDMVKMLKMQEKMLKQLVSAEAEAETESVASNTRSSEKQLKKQKRAK